MKFPTPLTIFLASPTSPTLLSSHPHLLTTTIASHPFSSSPHNNDLLARNVKVSVWWDVANCPVPNEANALKVSRNITRAVRANGIQGPLTITAYGDFMHLSRSTQQSLSATGVSLAHVPSGGENTALRSLLADLVFWAYQNPPPAHIFLISGDKNSAYILNRFRLNNYNILVASNDLDSGVLSSAASIMWQWYDLVRGESFSGKLLNEPPDGPLNSWYGHNRGPEGPFPDVGKHKCTQDEDSRTGCRRVIPTEVVNRIHQVVNSHPEGIDLSDLHSQLMLSNVNIDNDFFGYKKFSFLLQSLPTILELQTTSDDQIIAHGIPLKIGKPVVPPQAPEVINQHQPNVSGSYNQPMVTSSLDQHQPKVTGSLDQSVVTGSLDQPKVTGSLDQPMVTGSLDHPIVTGSLDQRKVAELDYIKLRQSPYSVAYDSDSRNVTGESSSRENVMTTDVGEKPSSPAHTPTKVELPLIDPIPIDKDVMGCHHRPVEVNNSIFVVGFFRKVWRTIFSHDHDASNMKSSNYTEICSTGVGNVEMRKCEDTSVSSSVYSSNLNGSVLEEKTKINSEVKDKSCQSVGMFPKIVELCNYWRTSTSLDKTNGHFCEDLDRVNDKTENNQLFLSSHFWEDMLSFLHTPRGAALISQSKTRDQMVRQLKRKGPSHLNTLAVGDINHLVNLLISEKKWVKESISKTFPFEVARTTQTASSLSNPHSLNELSSIVCGESSQSNVQRLPSHDRCNGKKKETQHGVLLHESNKRPSGKSKTGVLVDYHDTFGNNSILLGSHGIRNDPTVNVRSSNSELSDLTGVHYNDTLKELFPVSETKSKQSGIIGATTPEGMEHTGFDANSYFPDEFSESEGESSIKDGPNKKKQPNFDEEESSLLQLLDSFYSTNDKDIKDQLYNYDIDCSKIDLKLPSDIGADIIPIFRNGSAKKPQKAYSFVSDTVE